LLIIGGLLIGASINLSSHLFKAAVADVPFVDVVNTMSDPNIPLTIGEWEEWGNPNMKEFYDYMSQYCPYTNISKKVPKFIVLYLKLLNR
jgi:oligopeptidase B